MAQIIRELFCDPPIAVARLGNGTAPLAAYSWVTSANPRNEDDTGIVPDWTLDVMPDGSVLPFLPDAVRFRDGNAIRPVCPFIEVWARLGEPNSDPATWRDVPLTESLLSSFGVGLSALTITVNARNAKVARRTGDRNLAYGLFPSVTLRGDQHASVELSASSPPGAAKPMIPRDRGIPFGSIQVMRPRPNPAAGTASWPPSIDLEVVRFRFTPATGAFYGPPKAATATAESPVPAVVAANAFLNEDAGWYTSDGSGGGFVVPADTFDFFESGGNAVALGVVDDTCDARIEVSLSLAPAVSPALANIFVGPPDFAPDRRPFLSIADDLNDRSAAAAARSAAMSAEEIDIWVQDLFERVYETVSLMNVDFWRSVRGLSPLSGSRLAATPIPGDAIRPLNQALGGQDALRNPTLRVAGPTQAEPLPISQHARDRHRSLSDLQRLMDFVVSEPDRLKQLVRGPFEVEQGEGGGSTTMRMPPFMRASNANPLTLTAWQHDLLMKWVAAVPARRAVPAVAAALVAAAEPTPLSEAAARRQAEVLMRFG